MSIEKLSWKPVTSPMPSCGLLVLQEHRQQLKQILLGLADERLQCLRGSFNENIVVILGESRHLPWIPGGVYLGQAAAAPNILIPTHLEPNIPLAWLNGAIKRKFGEGQFVINPWQRQVYNLSHAMAVSRELVEEIE